MERVAERFGAEPQPEPAPLEHVHRHRRKPSKRGWLAVTGNPLRLRRRAHVIDDRVEQRVRGIGHEAGFGFEIERDKTAPGMVRDVGTRPGFGTGPPPSIHLRR